MFWVCGSELMSHVSAGRRIGYKLFKLRWGNVPLSFIDASSTNLAIQVGCRRLPIVTVARFDSTPTYLRVKSGFLAAARTRARDRLDGRDRLCPRLGDAGEGSAGQAPASHPSLVVPPLDLREQPGERVPQPLRRAPAHLQLLRDLIQGQPGPRAGQDEGEAQQPLGGLVTHRPMLPGPDRYGNRSGLGIQGASPAVIARLCSTMAAAVAPS